ncbi:MAG: SDR family NAD(P)-dependent oxidoreductase [Rubrobacter sp.]
MTGASSGIGWATSRALAAEGAVVYATAQRLGSLADLEASGLRALRLDVCDEASMVGAVRAVEDERGAIDVLVNNAGYMQSGALEEVSLDAVRDEFEVNVFGLLRMSQLVLPGMREKGGRIVNVGSVGGLFTAPGAGAYHMSKYAVESLSDAMRVEVKRFGVDVVLIQPTGVSTPFAARETAVIPTNGGPYAAFSENYNAGVAAMFGESGRGIVAPEDVARAIVEASSAKRPRTRYKVGLGARVIPKARRLLTDRAWDVVMARQFPMTPRETASKPFTRAET